MDKEALERGKKTENRLFFFSAGRLSTPFKKDIFKYIFMLIDILIVFIYTLKRKQDVNIIPQKFSKGECSAWPFT